ncbi:hypothetical protein V496_05048 [Pseudogymnoascus sp. VKM F-4515 (FW-2607)]|nr:hypothetical protein V496_05048 [Pseudogymnoascus sp. VKM F-4515 (FW-2607)]
MATITGNWTNWKSSAMFGRLYRYRINAAQYEYTETNDTRETVTTHSDPPPPNGQENKGRLSINSLLNPEKGATFHPPQRASQGSLGPARQPTPRYQAHRWRPYRPVVLPSSGSLGPASQPTPYKSRPRNLNVLYSLEQIHFIQYHRGDKGMQWQEILLSFNRCFPVFFLQNNNPKHQKEALSNLYYRAQMYPRIDNKGNLVLDQNGDEELVNIKLVTRCPERVLTYSWTDEEDKEKSRRIIATRATQGTCQLRGAELRLWPPSEAM